MLLQKISRAWITAVALEASSAAKGLQVATYRPPVVRWCCWRMGMGSLDRYGVWLASVGYFGVLAAEKFGLVR